MTSRRIPPEPVVNRLPDQAIRITVGRYVSTVHSEHLVPERILQLQRRSQRRVWGKGSSHRLSRWTEAMVREMRRLHLSTVGVYCPHYLATDAGGKEWRIAQLELSRKPVEAR